MWLTARSLRVLDAGPTTSPRNLLKAFARADEKQPGRRAVGGAAAIGGGMMTRASSPTDG